MLHCGLICGLVLAAATLFSYAFHVRNHYDDLDRILFQEARHAGDEAISSAGSLGALGQARENSGLEIILRYYDSSGMLRASSPDDLPALLPNAQALLHIPASSAFDALAGLIPPSANQPTSQNEILGQTTSADQRWRVLVISLNSSTSTAGYIVALMPLGSLDTWIGSLRLVLLTLWVVGLVMMVFGFWIVTRKTLQPVSRIAQTARTIALSHDFSRRVEPYPHHDEFGYLTQTFNEMLDSLAASHRLQQQFISDASHELRAPLTVIQGNLDLLHLQSDMPNSERLEALNAAERETSRMSRLVAELLTLARADAGLPIKRQPVELDSLVLDAFQGARRLAKVQTLILEPFEPVSVPGDEDRLKQLLLILLDNALKYTPAGGQITLGLYQTEGTVEITVKDTGVGIAAEDLPHIFERFYRADPARSRDSGGTGLGLSIAHWIVQQHHGEITVHSQVEHGTTFVVRLPVEQLSAPLSISSTYPQPNIRN